LGYLPGNKSLTGNGCYSVKRKKTAVVEIYENAKKSENGRK
jgi:hypothetical protein